MEPVIFVTDRTDEGERLAAVLRARGYSVVDVPIATLAERASVELPALIVCDLDVPEARTALEQVRALPGKPRARILVIGESGKSLDLASLDQAWLGGATLDEHAVWVGQLADGVYLRPADAYAVLRQVESLLGAPSSPRAGSGFPPGGRAPSDAPAQTSPGLAPHPGVPVREPSPSPVPPAEYDTRPKASEEPFIDSSWPPGPSGHIRAALYPPRLDPLPAPPEALARKKPDRTSPSLGRPPSRPPGELMGDEELDPQAIPSGTQISRPPRRRDSALAQALSPSASVLGLRGFGLGETRPLPPPIRHTQLSAETRLLLSSAEEQVRQVAKTPSQPPPRLSPDEEISAVLPDDVLDALDEPLDGYDDEDDELDSSPGTAGQGRLTSTRRPRRTRPTGRDRTSAGSGGSSGPPSRHRVGVPSTASSVSTGSSIPARREPAAPAVTAPPSLPPNQPQSVTSWPAITIPLGPAGPVVARAEPWPGSPVEHSQDPQSIVAERLPLNGDSTTPPPRFGGGPSRSYPTSGSNAANPMGGSGTLRPSDGNLRPRPTSETTAAPSLRSNALGRFGSSSRVGWIPLSNTSPPRQTNPPQTSPPRPNSPSSPRLPNTSPPSRIPSSGPRSDPSGSSASGITTSPPAGAWRLPKAYQTVPPALPPLSPLGSDSQQPSASQPPAEPEIAPTPITTPPRPEIPPSVGPGDAVRALARAIRARFTGSIAIESAEGVRRVVFREGDFVTASAGIDSESLVAFLIHRGALSAEAGAGLGRAIQPFGRHAGAALIAKGFLRQDELWPVLRAHAEWLIGRTLLVDQGAASREDDPPARLKSEPSLFGGDSGTGVLVELVRRVIPTEVALARLGGNRTRFVDGPASMLLSESNLRDQELAIVARAKSTALGDLLSGASSLDLTCVLYALTELGVLERLPVIGDRAPPVVEPTDDLDDAARRARVQTRRTLVEEGDYFALLGVERSATSYDVRRAYAELRKEFAPESILSARNADLRDTVQLILEVLDEAYGILGDPVKRERYRRALEGTPDRR